MELVKSTTSDLAGGIYSYIDNLNRLVLVNAAGELMWITHQQDAAGRWQLTVSQSVQIGFDAVVGLVPDYQWRIWFATAEGVAKKRGAVVGYSTPLPTPCVIDPCGPASRSPTASRHHPAAWPWRPPLSCTCSARRRAGARW